MKEKLLKYVGDNQSLPIFIIWVLGLIALPLIINPASLYFLNDDFIYISNSPNWNFLYRTTFRPISDITLFIDYTLYGKNATGYHWSNLIFHLIATVLVFKLARKWYSTKVVSSRTKLLPHIAAILFMAYPFHSESIFWIIGRGGSLVTIFFLAALLAILNLKNKWHHWLVCWILFALALLTYESSWLLPLACTLVIFFKINDNQNWQPIDKWGLAALWVTLIISFIVRNHYLNDFIGSPYLNTETFQWKPQKQLYNYATGFYRSFLPPLKSTVAFAILAILLTISLAIGLYHTFNKKVATKREWVLGLLFLLTLTPIFLLAVNTHTTESERFLYLPSAFLCILFSALIERIKQANFKHWTVGILSAICFLALFQNARSYKLASQWNQTSLLEINHYPGNYDTLHVYNLPAQYKGGFMFRLGFEEAIKWICPDVKFTSIVIHSKQEVQTFEWLKHSPIATKNLMVGRSHKAYDLKKENLQIVWDANQIRIFRKP